MNFNKFLLSTVLLAGFSVSHMNASGGDVGKSITTVADGINDASPIASNIIFQNAKNQDQADINRSAVGGTFFPDYFEEFFDFDNGINVFNRRIRDLGDMAAIDGESIYDTTAFSPVGRNGDFFTLIQNMRDYMDRTLTDDQRKSLLSTIYSLIKAQEGGKSLAQTNLESYIGSLNSMASMAYDSSKLTDAAKNKDRGDVLEAAIEALSLSAGNLKDLGTRLSTTLIPNIAKLVVESTKAEDRVDFREGDKNYHLASVDISLVEAVNRRNTANEAKWNQDFADIKKAQDEMKTQITDFQSAIKTNLNNTRAELRHYLDTLTPLIQKIYAFNQ